MPMLQLMELRSLMPPLPESHSAMPLRSHQARISFAMRTGLLRAGRRTGCRLTGNIRFRRGGSRRFLGRSSLPAFSCTGLSRSSAGLFTGNIRSRGGRRFLTRSSFSALSCTGLSRGSGLIRRAAFLHRSALLRGLRLRRVCPGHRLGRMRFSRALLVLWCRLFVWLLRQRGSSQRQRAAYQ